MCLALSLFHGFALFAQYYWGEEIAMRSKETKLSYFVCFHFGAKILSRNLFGDEVSEPRLVVEAGFALALLTGPPGIFLYESLFE